MRSSPPSDEMSPRPNSPLLFANHHHHHTKHSAARAADISRILDPSYSSSSASSSNVHAYVDRNGDLHDPDYRHFPIAHQPNTSKRHSSQSSHGYNLAARPRWELFDEDALDMEDDEYDVGEYPTNGRLNNRRPSSFSHTSSPSYSNYSYHPQPQQFHHNSPPHSTTFDSDDTVFDEYEEFEHEAFVEKEKEKEPRRSTAVSHILKSTRTKFATPPNTRSHSKERKRLPSTTISDDDATIVTVLSTSAATDSMHSTFPAVAHPLPPASTQSQYQEKEERERERSERRGRDLEREVEGERWTPTCTQALRREWQAVSLRIRFSVFRAQRRVKSRIASLT
jgi:hypothetical protein